METIEAKTIWEINCLQSSANPRYNAIIFNFVVPESARRRWKKIISRSYKLGGVVLCGRTSKTLCPVVLVSVALVPISMCRVVSRVCRRWLLLYNLSAQDSGSTYESPSRTSKHHGAENVNVLLVSGIEK